MNIEDLKCCGNCGHKSWYDSGDDDIYWSCHKKTRYHGCDDYCEEWVYDALVKEQRKREVDE